MNNQYDDPSFFQAYNEMPRSQKGLMAAGEWPQFVSMLPDLKDKTILDLGCGYGWHCMYAAKQNARHVVGIDASHRMIDQAIKMHSHPNIVYQVCDLTKYVYPIERFDVVISNLVLHYIEDLDVIYQNIYHTLKSSGIFVMNIEHPTFTAGIHEDWIYDKQGNALYWPVDQYYYPGQRKTLFLGKTVYKQHHTLTQIVNGLLKQGFILETLQEVMPPKEWLVQKEMKDEMRRPMMLLIRVKK